MNEQSRGIMRWIFGYGSLIWRPDFPFVARREGFVRGWRRVFYQGSTDHRGTPDAPGRVVTLLPDASARCYGVAFQLAPEAAPDILAKLDHREKGGYSHHEVDFYPAGAKAPSRALVYIATTENENYLGEASAARIAEQIRASHGPSGPNEEYLLELASALREIGAGEEDHVFEIERAFLALGAQ